MEKTAEEGLKQDGLFSGMIFLLLAAVSWPTFLSLDAISSADKNYTYVLFVPFISAWAAYRIYKNNRKSYSSSALGLPVVIFGLLLMFQAMWHDEVFPCGFSMWGQCTSAVGLIITLTGLCLALGGVAMVRLFAFPLAFLLFMVPWPWKLTDHLTLPMRGGISFLVTTVVRLIGIPVFREGNVLSLPTCEVGVADACSGLRAFMSLLASSVAISYVWRLKWLKGLCLAVISLVLAVTINFIRVLSTVLLIYKYGSVFEEGFLHSAIGVVLFCSALAVLLLMADRLETGQPARQDINSPARLIASAWIFTPINIAILVLMALFASAELVIHLHYADKPIETVNRKELKLFPDEIGGYLATEELRLPQEEVRILKFTDMVYRRYEKAGHVINCRILYWASFLRRGLFSRKGNFDPHDPLACLAVGGWTREALCDTVIPLGNRNIQISSFRKNDERRCIAYLMARETRRSLSELPSAILGRFKTMTESWNKPLIEHHAQYLVFIESDHDTAEGSCAPGISLFLEEIMPVLPEFGINQAKSSDAAKK